MSATVEALLAGTGLSRSEASMLLAHALGATRERLIAGSRDVVDTAVADVYRSLVARRIAGEPIAYLVGTRAFYGRVFQVDPRVLIPRPDTELLVDLALQRIDGDTVSRVLDLGTGSGAIAITISLERPAVALTATDVSADALAAARVNADRLGARVAFVAGDWYDALSPGASFDLVVSNPPYIANDDAHLTRGDLRFEPRMALTDDADGLAAIRCIVAGAGARLTSSGTLMIEHGHTQAAAVRDLFAAAGLDRIASVRDLAGIERVTVGHRAATGLPTRDA